MAFPAKRLVATLTRTIAFLPIPYPDRSETGATMTWLIGRSAAMADPERARAKVLEKLHSCVELEDPEGLVVPVLIDAIMLVESYRGARHQPTFLPELSDSVDALLRELTIIEKANEMAHPPLAACGTGAGLLRSA
jgi:hypothetical protein